LVLLVTTTLSVYKPWGRTRYGLRKRQEERRQAVALDTGTPGDLDSETTGAGISSGLGIFLAVIGVLIVAGALLQNAGRGFGRHP
jgi:hypothetical protein